MKSKNVSLAVEINPREGTETEKLAEKYEKSNVEIYPREGTETFCIDCIVSLSSLKFIPVRGRKRFRAF